MTSVGYLPPVEVRQRIAPTELDPWRGRVLRGEVHDENAAVMDGVSGHAGLFGSAEDLLTFAEWMIDGWAGGRPDSRTGSTAAPSDGPSIGAPLLREFTRRQNLVPGSSRALGWDTPSAGGSAGRLLSPTSFGHTGFTGTSLWIDPERRLAIVLLSNRVNPTRNNPRWNPVRAPDRRSRDDHPLRGRPMTLILSDWLIIALYFVVSAAIGLAYTRKASRSLEDYFVSGPRSALVAGRYLDGGHHLRGRHPARGRGAGGQVRSGRQLALVERSLLRRADRLLFLASLAPRRRAHRCASSPSCATAARPAAVLRGFRALYLALPINLIIMGWVTRAMVTILGVTLDVNPWSAAILLFGVTAALQHLLRSVGRHRHRRLPVRGRHGRHHSARRFRRGISRWSHQPGRQGRGALRVCGCRIRGSSRCRPGMAARSPPC